MMSDFTEEQKIQVTAKIVQDMLSYAVDYLRTSNRYCFVSVSLSFASRTCSIFFYHFRDDFSSLLLFTSPRTQSSLRLVSYHAYFFLSCTHLHSLLALSLLLFLSVGSTCSAAQTRFEESLRDAFLVLSSPLLKVRS